MTEDCLRLPTGPIDDDTYRHCRHCDDDCSRIHYDPCPCQIDRSSGR